MAGNAIDQVQEPLGRQRDLPPSRVQVVQIAEEGLANAGFISTL
jgi:hypothetical protein